MNYNGTYKMAPAASGSVSRRCPDTSKAKQLLGYEPQTFWREGVSKTVEWYKDYLKSGKDVFE
jgi:nucleoside-diphosphate-sugar epimerase